MSSSHQKMQISNLSIDHQMFIPFFYSTYIYILWLDLVSLSCVIPGWLRGTEIEKNHSIWSPLCLKAFGCVLLHFYFSSHSLVCFLPFGSNLGVCNWIELNIHMISCAWDWVCMSRVFWDFILHLCLLQSNSSICMHYVAV